MKIGPHLHRIGNDIVAAYLIDTDDGVTLIDAGLPGHWRDFTRELEAMGRTVSDVRGVVLTHGDSDHLGFAERLRKETGIPVYVHAADAERAKGGDKPKPPSSRMKIGGVVSFFAYAARKGGLQDHLPDRGDRGGRRRRAAAARVRPWWSRCPDTRREASRCMFPWRMPCAWAMRSPRGTC